jgi:hypothetical protein
MLAYSTAIPFSFLERQTVETPVGQLFRIWKQNNGLLTSDTNVLAHHLVVLENDPGGKELPPILMMGKHTLAAAILGQDWSFTPERQNAAIPRENRQIMQQGYAEARQGEPSYRQIAHEAHLLNGNRCEIFYEQFILPFKSQGDQGFFLTLSTPVSVPWDRFETSHGDGPEFQKISHQFSGYF